MKIVKLSVGIFILVLFICANVYAAPIGNPSDTRTPPGKGIFKLKDTIGSVKVSLDAESILERDLNGSTDAQLEGQWYMARISYPLFQDVLEPYVKIGTSDLETSWKTAGGGVVIVRGDIDLAWGIGARFLAYEMPKYRVKFIIDGQYRSTEPGMDDVTVDQPSRTVSAFDFKVHEWQIGGIVSIELPLGQSKSRYGKSDIYTLIPYFGIAYTDCDTTTKFTYTGAEYDIGSNAGNEHKATLIAGCDFVCPENLSVNVEGKIIGETSVSGGATVRF